MSQFKWQNRFDVGVPDMNGEHRKLMAMMDKLYTRNAAGASKVELLGLLSQLGSFTKEHFDHEEAYMASIGFPGLAVHKVVHENLLNKLDTHVSAFRAGTQGKLPEALFSFLKVWLASHICGIDMRYGDHAKATGKAA